jgi:hypothetical protein
LVHSVGQERLWQTPWIKTTFNNGAPARDGNPIFSALAPGCHLGVRVIQVEPGNDADELQVWTGIFGDAEGSIRELVVHCVLSDDTLHEAGLLISQWITDESLGQRKRASADAALNIRAIIGRCLDRGNLRIPRSNVR